jgi:RNA polymerase sigma factor (sigma-70 family)
MLGVTNHELTSERVELLLALLERAQRGERQAYAAMVAIFTDECRTLSEGKRYFAISAMRETARHALRQLALDPSKRLLFYQVFADAVLAAMASSATPGVSKLGGVLQETLRQLSESDPAKTLLLRLHYVIGLNWEEISALPLGEVRINSPEKAFIGLGAELEARGLSQELLQQQNLRPRGEVTQLLEDVRDGQRPLGDVVAHESKRLHRQAEHLLMRELGNISMQADDLVNEVFLRMPRDPAKSPTNHMEFESLTKRIMRHVLIDRARKPVPGQSRYSEELHEESLMSHASVEDRLMWEKVVQVVDEVILDVRQNDPEGAAMLRATLYSDVDQKELAKLYDVSVSTVKRRVKEGRDMIRSRLGMVAKS